jgi:hypothetical protein
MRLSARAKAWPARVLVTAVLAFVTTAGIASTDRTHTSEQKLPGTGTVSMLGP